MLGATTGDEETAHRLMSGMYALRGDADQLRRVLLNLVENALKFTPPGGYVELRAANEKQGWVMLEIQDTGAGIPPETLPHVTEQSKSLTKGF